MRSKSVSKGKEAGETISEGFASTCSVLAVGLFALTFVFQNFVIPSSSMASTLLVGDHVAELSGIGLHRNGIGLYREMLQSRYNTSFFDRYPPERRRKIAKSLVR